MWVREFLMTLRAYKPSSEPTSTTWRGLKGVVKFGVGKSDGKLQKLKHLRHNEDLPVTWSVRGIVQLMSKRSSPSSFSKELPRSFYEDKDGEKRERDRSDKWLHSRHTTHFAYMLSLHFSPIFKKKNVKLSFETSQLPHLLVFVLSKHKRAFMCVSRLQQ